jgi:deleted-in-malignant-brain-tumors protein 1
MCNTTVYEECQENVCLNGGTCQSFIGDITCTCVIGFSGVNCNETNTTIVTEESPTFTTDGLSISLIVFITLCIIMITGTIVTVFSIVTLKRKIMKMKESRMVKRVYETELENFQLK